MTDPAPPPPATTPRVVGPDSLTSLPPEKQLLQCIMDAARLFGWSLVYHTHDSRHSTAGFPDAVLIRPGSPAQAGRILWIECKRGSRDRLSPAQQAWGAALLSAGQDWRVWRWSDWLDGTVEKVLREGA